MAGLRVDDPLTIYDVTPTVLHLLGLDIPTDLPGRVRLDLFDPSWVLEHPLRPRVAFTGSPIDLPPEGDEGQEDSATEARLREELRALGYIE